MRCCVQNIPVSVFIIQLLHFHCCQESKCLVSDGISLWTVFISQTQEHEAHPNNIWCGPVKWKMKRLEERLRDENCRVQSVEFKLKFKGPLICRLWEEWQFGSGLVDKGVTASWRWTQSDQPEVVQWVKLKQETFRNTCRIQSSMKSQKLNSPCHSEIRMEICSRLLWYYFLWMTVELRIACISYFCWDLVRKWKSACIHGTDLEKLLALFSMAEGTPALIWEASFLPHAQVEHIKTKLFTAAAGVCISSHKSLEVCLLI